MPTSPPVVPAPAPATAGEVDAAADLVLETVPSVMRAIRTEMRRHGASGITVPEFRALLFVRRRSGASLAELAGHLGIGAPSASVLVDRLVRDGLLERDRDPIERRRIVLTLTDDGRRRIDRAHDRTRSWLTARLATVSPADLGVVAAGLASLARAIDREDGAAL